MTIQGFIKTGCTVRLVNPRTLRVAAGTVRDDVDGSTITVTEGDIDVNASGVGGLDTGAIAAGTYAVYSIDGGGVDEKKILSLELTGSPTLPSGYTVWGFICYVRVIARGSLYEFSGTFNDYEDALGSQPMMMRALARMWATVVTAIGTADTFLGNVIGDVTGNVTGLVNGVDPSGLTTVRVAPMGFAIDGSLLCAAPRVGDILTDLIVIYRGTTATVTAGTLTLGKLVAAAYGTPVNQLAAADYSLAGLAKNTPTSLSGLLHGTAANRTYATTSVLEATIASLSIGDGYIAIIPIFSRP